MVNVEHHVAVSALRMESTKFKLLVSRDVPASMTRSSTAVAGSSDNRQDHQNRQRWTSSLPRPAGGSTELPSSLLNTTSLGKSVHLVPTAVGSGPASAKQVITILLELMTTISNCSQIPLRLGK